MDFANRLVAAFPNFTVIDVAAVIGQIQGMVDQLISAVQFVFAFAVVAGVVVLFGALQATHDEREKELSILRTLGARNAQLRSALLAEFAVLGVVSGALAGTILCAGASSYRPSGPVAHGPILGVDTSNRGSADGSHPACLRDHAGSRRCGVANGRTSESGERR